MNKIDNDEKEKRADIVNSDFSGIIPYFEAFYLNSIFYSSSRCLYSFEQYEHFKGDDETPPEILISIVQEAVGHSAALSRYFWPSPSKSKKNKNQNELKIMRGQKLRAFYELTDESVLYDRDLRNAWEHFDERLDSYLLEQIAGQFFPDCIIGSHTLLDDPVSHVFKLLDPKEECLVLMNKKYFFKPIKDEVTRIFDVTYNALNNGARLVKKEL